MAKILFYRENCIGCSACVESASNFWEISGKDGKSVLKNGVKKKDVYVLEIDEIEKEENEKAKENCPMGIIKLVK